MWSDCRWRNGSYSEAFSDPPQYSLLTFRREILELVEDPLRDVKIIRLRVRHHEARPPVSMVRRVLPNAHGQAGGASSASSGPLDRGVRGRSAESWFGSTRKPPCSRS